MSVFYPFMQQQSSSGDVLTGGVPENHLSASAMKSHDEESINAKRARVERKRKKKPRPQPEEPEETSEHPSYFLVNYY